MSKGPQPVHYKDGAEVRDLRVVSRIEDSDTYIVKCTLEGCGRRVRVLGSRLRGELQTNCGAHTMYKYGKPIPPARPRKYRYGKLRSVDGTCK